jgi:hypothetical protein
LSRLRSATYAALFITIFSPVFAPQLLAFPYSAQVGGHAVYSEVPIAPRLARSIAAANARVAQSAIGRARLADQPIFLTQGGWRWTWLSVPQLGAFAITRPFSETIVVNRSDQRTDTVANRAKIAGQRSLSGVLAHEMTHGLIRARFGTTADWRYPAWVREGYCDYVAGGGSLSDAEAKRLQRIGHDHPALVYWRGRKQVENELARNGGSVDALFAAHRG